MTKKRITIDIDVPDELSKLGSPFLRQEIYDSMVNYMATSHLQDVMTWLVHSNDEEKIAQFPEWKQRCQMLVDYHKSWANIIEVATFTVEDVE